MAILHRALLSWFLGLVFLILLVIRLDQRITWNWFIVFIPMWIFDFAVMTYAGFYLFTRCRAAPREICHSFFTHNGHIHFVIAVIFKMALQILICLKLEVTSWDLPLYFVFIPLWCVLAAVIISLIYFIMLKA